jgi:glucosyl-3-phosphoglycerate phosphatase
VFDMNELMNRYHIMRHGQSKANVLGIIVSCPDNDRNGDYGLTELGREQALAAASASGLPPHTVIYSSDFSRARETAEIVRARLGAPEVRLATALRERCFGSWEGTDTANYAKVWAADEAGPADEVGRPTENSQTESDVEPPSAVLHRLTDFIASLEQEHTGKDILLVSHGDTLQILQAGCLHMNPARHRQLPHLETAGIRRIT